MTVADYVTDYLIKNGVTDVFGIPGGSILKFIYAVEKRSPEIVPHLNYHEQMAGFAACGYAQNKKRLGVAYATRGPGITNMLTCMAEAYQESIPVLFITAYVNRSNRLMRCEFGQEIDIVESVKSFTKYAASVDEIGEVQKHLEMACHAAMDQRKGPVFLDFSSKLFGMEFETKRSEMKDAERNNDRLSSDIHNAVEVTKQKLLTSERPVILIGDGIRQADCIEAARACFSGLNVPIISSRAAQDVVCNLSSYYGYIGSHASRYSNFILSKADLIIVIGNSLSFPVYSKSFRPIVNKAQMVRIDIDDMEFQRELPKIENFCIDVQDFISELAASDYQFRDDHGWIDICDRLKRSLNDFDMSEPVKEIVEYLKYQSKENVYVCDVGNNEFWFSRAFEFVRPDGQVLYSKMFGTLGSAIGRAIGIYYATSGKVVCVVGDQGFQYNIQELQYISYWKLPITILLLNNSCSGMIRDHERTSFEKYLHVTSDTGYGTPDFKKIVEGYGIKFVRSSVLNRSEREEIATYNAPAVYEITFGKELELEPKLPAGNICQRMYPPIDEELYQYLDKL